MVVIGFIRDCVNIRGRSQSTVVFAFAKELLSLEVIARTIAVVYLIVVFLVVIVFHLLLG